MILSDNGKPMLFSAFKTRFGIWKPMRYGSGPRFLQLDVTQGDKGYRDLDQLNKLIAPYCSFLTQKDVFEHLPEESEEYIYFEMSDAQKKAYRELRDELETELASGIVLTAQQAMVRILRLQQISRGFVSIDGTVHDLGTPRPSVNALLDFLAQTEGKFVIWCRFTADVDAVLSALKGEGIEALRFDGSVPANDRPGLLARFESEPNIRGIVGTAGAGGVGVDMSAADTVVFYSMDYSLVNWDQARSRIQNMNKTAKKLVYAYVLGRNTGDELLLERVRGKDDLSVTISGADVKRILQISRGKSDIEQLQGEAVSDALSIFFG
jgi:SNF2 family DNA or RNA helicase